VKSLFEVLRERGYETSVFYSSFFDYTNFRDLLRHHGVDRMYDADTMPGTRTTKPVSWGLDEVETLTAINRQIRDYATNDTRFFLTYVPAAPHYPFDGIPSQFRKYESTRLGDYTPRYLNELLYMDWVIASILDELKQTGLLDQTLVVITSDHGELLGGERGDPIGHGWLITPELANVPLIILDPGRKGYALNHTVGSQVDLLPTVLHRLGVPLPAGQFYQGVALDGSAAISPRTAYLNSFRQFATLQGRTIACGDREGNESNEESLREITNVGSRTLFPVASTEAQPVDIRRFDKFQENFLRHYAAYARTFGSTNAIP
jgi:phosphoglycerol transferase MdoB-like AlkP superfamily enzyme